LAVVNSAAEPSPLQLLDKSAVLQECRVFHDAKFVKNHPKRCCQLITKLLYLLTRGETVAGSEASEVFFGVTKLFQSTDVRFVACILVVSSVCHG
jgi:coatomer subunit gamma